MLASSYHEFKTSLDRQGVILCYSGLVSERVLFSLGEILRRRMESEDTNQAKKVFSVFVEQVQNIIRYSDDRLPPATDPAGGTDILGSGLIVVGNEPEGYFVTCANVIEENRTERLRSRLDHIAGLDKDGLKALYRQKIKEPPEEESLGGSIGLIEIARRASRPLEYDFRPIREGRSFFCLKAYI